MVYGLTLMISLQGLINMAMVLGSFPVTGVPLPFISFGGTSLMTNICSVGLIYGTAVQSIENTEREVRKKRIQAMDGVNPSGSNEWFHSQLAIMEEGGDAAFFYGGNHGNGLERRNAGKPSCLL